MAKNKYKNNPVGEIPEKGYVEVFRLQNAQGKGPYYAADNKTPYAKYFEKATLPGGVTNALMSPTITPVLFAIADGMARVPNDAGDIFRKPPNIDEFSHSDMTFFRKQKPLTGFLDFEQFSRWFPFEEELLWLHSLGYNLYKFKTKNYRYADLQILFVPEDSGEIYVASDEDRKIYSKYQIKDIKQFIMNTIDMNQ